MLPQQRLHRSREKVRQGPELQVSRRRGGLQNLPVLENPVQVRQLLLHLQGVPLRL
ncbi:UNVERIFIED_CONTAM: hypothetical protein PYX00_000183 [Menopon gallinae]|uniref:Uncharacterized protein n=1 Tax=Menopon gallinae TaxID=328185 RepID=A0AAW2I873_9NEOP